jgi:hypothetical protein
MEIALGSVAAGQLDTIQTTVPFEGLKPAGTDQAYNKRALIRMGSASDD